MRRVLIVLAVALLVAGGLWWSHGPTHPGPVDASLYETDMTENLLRSILSGFKAPVPPVCFLAFGEGRTAPSQAFLDRFNGSQPAVRGCKSAVSPPTGQYFDVTTGRPGVMVHIIRFKETLPGTFDVLVSFSNLPRGHDRYNYHITLLGGDWLVKSPVPA